MKQRNINCISPHTCARGQVSQLISPGTCLYFVDAAEQDCECRTDVRRVCLCCAWVAAASHAIELAGWFPPSTPLRDLSFSPTSLLLQPGKPPQSLIPTPQNPSPKPTKQTWFKQRMSSAASAFIMPFCGMKLMATGPASSSATMCSSSSSTQRRMDMHVLPVRALQTRELTVTPIQAIPAINVSQSYSSVDTYILTTFRSLRLPPS